MGLSEAKDRDAGSGRGTSRRGFLAQSAVSLAGLAFGTGSVTAAPAAEPADGDRHTNAFLLGWSEGTLTSLRCAGDSFPTEYLAPGERLGHLLLTWRRPAGAWVDFETSTTKGAQTLPVAHQGCAARYTVGDAQGDALQVESRMQAVGPTLRWTVTLHNLAGSPVEVGDLALPLPMHTEFKGGEPPTASVLKHSFISGSGSFLFWMRSNSVGPYLLMTPEKTTALEYWERTRGTEKKPSVYRVYVHSAAKGEKVAAAGGRWRQPHTSLTLAAAGKAGSSRTYAFQLRWAGSYSSVERMLAESGLLDVQVAPGMTVPTDLFTDVAFRSANPVVAVTAEHPEQTTVEPLGRRGNYQHYRVQFARLGENMLTAKQADGRVTRLEFFATEPLETLIQKRGSFIASHQQRDSSKWYNGLLSEWNMDSGVMPSPDNYDRIKGWRIYEVTCDDPGLSKPAFLASKLAEFPVETEVAALDDYIEHFVWGGLQRTTKESDSYGIYGILDWKRNRDSPDPGDKGQRHMWRPYDYPHIIVMYWGMYRVARDFPGIRTRLSREQYLDRTFGTAMALFTVPKQIIGWEAYETGFYNEVVVPALIDELGRVGRPEQAELLRTEWEKKVRFFVTGGPDLFGSEYAFDSTGFESTQALARYALDRTATGAGTMRLPAPDSKLKEGAAPYADVSRAEVRTFAATQMQANLFCRGVVEKAYYLYGSDYRAEGGDAYTLSYMAQMGGWGVLDHALHDATVPDATVRLGYASYLSAWALMNTGTAASNYGYWYPGVANDGGAGGGFEPAAMGMTWLGQPHHRGSWYYSSEEDLGFCGALRTAATVVADDAVFGRFCFGGVIEEMRGGLRIEPRDGVRRRLFLRTGGKRLDLEIIGARFAAGQKIECSAALDAFVIPVEREAAASGELRLHASSGGPYRYRARLRGGEWVTGGDAGDFALPMRGTSGILEIQRETATAA